MFMKFELYQHDNQLNLSALFLISLILIYEPSRSIFRSIYF